MMGYWTTEAAKLAKFVKNSCVTCKILDHKPSNQIMGGIPRDQLIDPVAWNHVEVDLFGPFLCRSDVNKRSSLKVWGIVFVDRCSGATHCDVLLDYSTVEIIRALRRFASLRGWPLRMYSDPGSQLESAAGKLTSWWQEMKQQLASFAAERNFSWEISPADSPWRQGRAEVRIKSLKKLIIIAVGSSRLTPVELQTVFYEVANLSNERPIGLVKVPSADGSFKVLTPNNLLLGRSLAEVPDDTHLETKLKKSERYKLIQHVTAEFWRRWSAEVTPQFIIRQKWHQDGRNLRCGDVVLIHDSSSIKGKYVMGIIEETVTGKDGRVRSCSVAYSLPGENDSVRNTGRRRIVVKRSIQRLTLLLAKEDQESALEVVGDVVKVKE